MWVFLQIVGTSASSNVRKIAASIALGWTVMG
jgi:hypothetical protein